MQVLNKKRFCSGVVERRCSISDDPRRSCGAKQSCVHVNLLDRKSQLPVPDRHMDAAKPGEIAKILRVSYDAEEILGGIGLPLRGESKARSRQATAFQLRVRPREQQALPLR